MVYGLIRVRMELAGAPLARMGITREFTKAFVAFGFAAALQGDVTVMQIELDQRIE